MPGGREAQVVKFPTWLWPHSRLRARLKDLGCDRGCGGSGDKVLGHLGRPCASFLWEVGSPLLPSLSPHPFEADQSLAQNPKTSLSVPVPRKPLGSKPKDLRGIRARKGRQREG